MIKGSMLIFAAVFFIAVNAGAQVKSDSVKITERYSESKMYYTPKSDEAFKLYNEAHDYFNDGDLRSSVSGYSKALEIEPGFIDAMDNLGNSYRFLGILDSAEYWYKKSIAIYPEGFIAHQNLALVYLRTLEYDKALKEYDKLTELDPENAEGYFGKANVYIYLSKGEKIVDNAQKALAIYKKSGSAYEMDALYLIGVGYYLQKDNEEAKKYLKEASAMGMKIPAELQELIK